ncbi:MAG: hypothetical protein HKL80_02290 [Acidimicrobiales bacterium]|nr:hypothetical protein [Acidimicrobiales bacterium]
MSKVRAVEYLNERKLIKKDYVALAFIVIAYLLFLRYGFRHSGAAQEEGEILSEAYLASHGLMMYRDFNNMYGPLGIWDVAFIFKLFGSSIYVERAIGAIYEITTIIAAFRIGAIKSTVFGVAASIPFLLFFVSGADGGLYAWPWYLALSLSLWAIFCLHKNLAVKDGAIKWGIIGAVLISLAILTRFDFAIALIPIAVIYLIPLNKGKRLSAFLGLLLAPVGYLIQAILSGFSATFYYLFVNPQHELSGNYLPLPPPTGELAAYFDRESTTIHRVTWSFPSPSLALQLNLIFWAGIVFFGLGLAVIILRVLKDRDKKPYVLIAIMVFELGTAPASLQRPDSSHLMQFFLTAALFVVLGAAYIADGRSLFTLLKLAAGICSLVLMCFLIPAYTIAPTIYSYQASVDSNEFRTYEVTNLGHQFFFGDVVSQEYANETLKFVDSIASKNSSLVVAITNLQLSPYNDSYLYYMLPQLYPGTKYLIFYPDISLNDGKKFASELAKANILILSSKYWNWVEPNSSVTPGSLEPGKVVSSKYCQVAQFHYFEVLVNKSDPPHGISKSKLDTCP